MRTVTLASLAAVAGGLLLAAQPASAAERGFVVRSFDRVRASGPFDVVIRTGGAPAVRASGPQAALDRLVVTSEDGVLSIRPEKGDWKLWRGWLPRGEKVVVSVSAPALRAVSLAGSGTVTVDRARAAQFAASVSGSGDLTVNDLQAEGFALTVAGSGDLTVSGRARTGKASVAGSGDIHGEGLRVATAELAVAGSGDVRLGATDSATVSVVGSGDVYVTGGARCTTSKHGSGDVHCG
jgi:hypothetical protein